MGVYSSRGGWTDWATGPQERCQEIAGGPRKVRTVVVAVYRNEQELPESLHAVKPDVLKTSPQRYVRPLCAQAERTGGLGHGVGMDGTDAVWMLILLPLAQVRHVVKTPLRPQCHR